MNYNKVNIQSKISTYGLLTESDSFDIVIYNCFDYLLRVDISEYKLLLDFLYEKYNYKVFNTIIVGILKNFNLVNNYTLDDLDNNYSYYVKKNILNAYRLIKEKDKYINDYYVKKIKEYNEYFNDKTYVKRRVY